MAPSSDRSDDKAGQPSPPPEPTPISEGGMAATVVSIPKGPLHLSGLLFQPSMLANGAALIIVTPGDGVKGSQARMYARKLSERGFTALCYDTADGPEPGGQSSGNPLLPDDPSNRVAEVWSAVDYLQSIAGLDTGVDAGRIGAVGICAGGGYAVAAAKRDHRIRALATVSLVDVGDTARRGWDGTGDPGLHAETLRQAVAWTADPNIDPSLGGNTGSSSSSAAMATGVEDSAMGEGTQHEYYLTPRAQHPTAANGMLVQSWPMILGFDAFHMADLYLTQSLLLIAGEEAGSRWQTERLDELVGGATRKIVVPGRTHVDLYDKEEGVDGAVKDICEFMTEHLLQ